MTRRSLKGGEWSTDDLLSALHSIRARSFWLKGATKVILLVRRDNKDSPVPSIVTT